MAYGGYSFGSSLTPWVKRLLIANVAVFVLAALVRPVAGWLAFVPSAVLFRPWTLLTYMFVHAGFLHLLFNMLMLFFFGPQIEGRWGSREFVRYYVLCGLGAAALSFVFAFNAAVVGASGAIYGVMVAFAVLWPDARIYFWGIFPIPAKWLVLGLVGFSLFMTVSPSGDGIAHAAHLGGAAAGFLYLRFGDNFRWRWERMKKKASRPRLKVTPGGLSSTSPSTAGRRPRRNSEEERLLDEVDRVLDKISSSGMASLTPEERKVLDEVSKRYRKD